MAPDESADEAARRAAQKADAERQRLAAEQRPARQSDVMLQMAPHPAVAQAGVAPTAATPELSPLRKAAEPPDRSDDHPSDLQSIMPTSSAVFLQKKQNN